MTEAFRQTAESGHDAPHQHANSDNNLPVFLVRQPAQRNTGEGVKNRKGKALQKSDLGIADIKIGLDRVHQQGNDLSVDIGNRKGDEQDDHHIPGIGRFWIDRVIFTAWHGDPRFEFYYFCQATSLLNKGGGL